MKKAPLSFRITIILSLVFFLSAPNVLCQAQKEPFCLAHKLGQIDVQIDYRIEALSVIQVLAEYPIVTQFETPLKKFIII